MTPPTIPTHRSVSPKTLIVVYGVVAFVVLAIITMKLGYNQGTGGHTHGAGHIQGASEKTIDKTAVKTQAALTDSAVIIYNLDDFTWQSMMVYLNGTPLDGYRAGPYGPIPPNHQFRIPFTEFVRGDLRFNAYERKVQQLIVSVDGRDAPILGFR